MDTDHSFVVTTPHGCVDLLAEELRLLGALGIRQRWGGIEFRGSVLLAYRVCLWSRLANRVLLPLSNFEANNPEQLYDGASKIDWSKHVETNGTFAVDCQSFRSPISHSHFAALKVKDALADQFMDSLQVRPSVDVRRPDVRIHARLSDAQATLCIDLSGKSLHQRGYRKQSGLAPLKENVAAAILQRAGWLDVFARGGSFVDPMCGSGTLVIEAALMAGDVAPGLLRSYMGFLGWKQHQAFEWKNLLDEALERRKIGLKSLPELIGNDADSKAIENARENAECAQIGDVVRFFQRELRFTKVPVSKVGLLLTNPPYGERMGSEQYLRGLYSTLGETIKTYFLGWKVAVFTGRSDLGRYLGMRATLTNKFRNGKIDCRLLRFEVVEENFEKQNVRASVTSSASQMLINRLKKNKRIIGRWARRSNIHCYRLYDADLPEYALAIDLYQSDELWVHVQEYQAPSSIDSKIAKRRLEEALSILPEALGVASERIHFKVRKRQRGSSQYQRMSSVGRFHQVVEGPGRFLVNFTDYLDTGLFLDHRPIRKLIGSLANGRSFLNLFGYTGAASVIAALFGARATTTVDISKTYLDWAAKNFELNGITEKHNALEQSDCIEWLKCQSNSSYDLILVDPPTFSNSKRMRNHFEVQKDHVDLLRSSAELLSKDGILIFSNNFRRFKFDYQAFNDWYVEDLTKMTIDRDFERNARVHYCWRIQKRS